MTQISTIIPVYKNIDSFKELFNHNYPLFKNTEVIIIDDASGENWQLEFKKIYPDVNIYSNEKNEGFASSVNKGLSMAHGELILLLNSDVKLLDNSFENCSSLFSDEKVFAISFLQIEKNGEQVGKNETYFQRGLFQHKKAGDSLKGNNGWAEGGSCLIRREYMKQLGGMDLLFKPFYWEDIDLSYRAYQKGWYVLFNPEIKVEHHHESTIGKYFDKNFIEIIAFKNQFLFTWKNIRGVNLLLHIVWLPYNLVYFLLKGKANFMIGFLKAFGEFFLSHPGK